MFLLKWELLFPLGWHGVLLAERRSNNAQSNGFAAAPPDFHVASVIFRFQVEPDRPSRPSRGRAKPLAGNQLADSAQLARHLDRSAATRAASWRLFRLRLRLLGSQLSEEVVRPAVAPEDGRHGAASDADHFGDLAMTELPLFEEHLDVTNNGGLDHVGKRSQSKGVTISEQKKGPPRERRFPEAGPFDTRPSGRPPLDHARSIPGD